MGYSPWGRKESHMTERLHLTLIKCPLGTYRKIRLKKERRRKEEEKKKERSIYRIPWLYIHKTRP